MFTRIRFATKVACAHLLLSAIVAGGCAYVLYLIWYPYPYGALAGGTALISIVVSVDIICGPLLSFLVASPFKPRSHLRRDLAIIAAIQLCALAYGLHTVFLARPVWLAFEGDRFRVVSQADVDMENISKAPFELQGLSLSGPKLLGVKLLNGDDPEYVRSIELSLTGLEPAFRPARWVKYQNIAKDAAAAGKPVSLLLKNNPDAKERLARTLAEAKLKENDAVFLPIASRENLFWVAILKKGDGIPISYLALDGWAK